LQRPPEFIARALIAGALAWLGLASAVRAQDAVPEATEPATLHDPVPLWEIGLVGIAAWQPAYPGSDQNIGRVRALPFGIYRGSVLRVDGGGVGVRALRTPRFEWDVSGSGSFGSSANKVRVRAGMPSIGTLVEIGPALRINLGDLVDARRNVRATHLDLPIRAVFDVNDGFAHRGWTFEPRLAHTAWTGRSTSLIVSASALFGDRSLNDLYYGVATPYATADRPAYRADAGLVATRLNASLLHRVTGTIRMQYFAQLETVRGAANEGSPLVRSRQDAGLGVSVIWGAWHSAERGAE
jgi:outer membrane protein